MSTSPFDIQVTGMSVEYDDLVTSVQYSILVLSAQYNLPVAVTESALLAADAYLDYRGLIQFYQETITSTDIAAFALGKAYTEIVSVGDSKALGFETARAETLTVSDLFSSVIQYYRAFTEQMSTVDSTAIGFGQATADSVSPDDAIDSFNFSKVLADTITTTESLFIGFADAENDSVAADDFGATDDDPPIFLGKNVSDTASSADASSLGISPAYSDSAASSDALTSINTQKGLSEAPAASDSTAIAYSTSFTESTSPTDTVAIGSAPVLSDTQGIADAAYADVQKLLTESQAIADSIATLFSTSFADSAASTGDALVNSVGKNVADTSTQTDTGVLRKTDYADITFFSEDYTGLQATF
jgi:hypothetical protein